MVERCQDQVFQVRVRDEFVLYPLPGFLGVCLPERSDGNIAPLHAMLWRTKRSLCEALSAMGQLLGVVGSAFMDLGAR